jgi:fructoselysine-6-P-deglycase FrlB-like protein
VSPRTLREIYIRTSRSGNTTAIVAAAKALGATLVVHDEREAQRVRAMGVKAVPIPQGARGFAGAMGPYVFDVPVLDVVARHWERDIERADRSARLAGEECARADRAEAEVRRLRAQVAELAERVMDLEAGAPVVLVQRFTILEEM